MGGIDWSRKSLGFTSGIVLDRRLQSLQLLGWSVVYIWGKFYLFFSFLYGFKKKKKMQGLEYFVANRLKD